MRDASMTGQPEILRVGHSRVVCDGADDIPGGVVLGHPRVWLEIDESGFVDCGYCARRFILAGGPVDTFLGNNASDKGVSAG